MCKIKQFMLLYKNRGWYYNKTEETKGEKKERHSISWVVHIFSSLIESCTRHSSCHRWHSGDSICMYDREEHVSQTTKNAHIMPVKTILFVRMIQAIISQIYVQL